MRADSQVEWWRPGWTAEEDKQLRAIGAPASTDTGSSLAFSALVAFTFVLLIAPQTIFPILSALRIAFLTALVAATAHVVHQFIHRQPLLVFTREVRLVVALAGWAIATIPLSYWPGGSISFLLEIYFKTLVVFWLLVSLVNTLPRLKFIAWTLALSALPLALTGVKNFLEGVYVKEMTEGRILGYVAPLTENPNDLALMLNLLLPLNVGLLLGSRRFAVRMALFGIIGINVIAIIATFSRAGFLVLAITFLLYLRALIKRSQVGLACLALVIVFASVPFLPENYVNRLGTILEIETDPTGSAQTRWADSLAAVRYVFGNPLIGAGIGMDALAMNEMRGETWTKVHNVYLQHAVELGIPGFILFLLLLKASLGLAREIQRRTRFRPELSELFYLAEGIQISLIAFAVAALYHPVAHQFYFYYFAGLAIGAKAVLSNEEKRVAAPQP